MAFRSIASSHAKSSVASLSRRNSIVEDARGRFVSTVALSEPAEIKLPPVFDIFDVPARLDDDRAPATSFSNSHKPNSTSLFHVARHWAFSFGHRPIHVRTATQGRVQSRAAFSLPEPVLFDGPVGAKHARRRGSSLSGNEAKLRNAASMSSLATETSKAVWIEPVPMIFDGPARPRHGRNARSQVSIPTSNTSLNVLLTLSAGTRY